MKYLSIILIMAIGIGVVYCIATDDSPAYIVDIDYEDKIVYVKLHSQLVSGSDGACQAAGQTILYILEELDPGWQVFIVNTWVPSEKNPINIEWAKVLAEGY